MSVADAITTGLFNIGGSAVNWGLANKSNNRYKSAVRHLRRREYQDMVFSMKQAGLNPMLATGATPGHSAMVAAPVPDMSNLGSAITAANVSGRQAGAAERQAGAHERTAGVAEGRLPAEIANLNSQGLLRNAQIGQIYEQNALTAATTAKTKAETDLALQESGTAAVKRLLMQRQAEREGWTAKEIEARIPVTASGWGTGLFGGLIRSAQRADEASGGWQTMGGVFNSGLDAIRSLGGKISTSAKDYLEFNAAQEQRAKEYQDKYRGK